MLALLEEFWGTVKGVSQTREKRTKEKEGIGTIETDTERGGSRI